MPSSRKLICSAPKPPWTWRWLWWRSQRTGNLITMPPMLPISQRLVRRWPRWTRMEWCPMMWAQSGWTWTRLSPGARFKLHQSWGKTRLLPPQNGSITPLNQPSRLHRYRHCSTWKMLVKASQILWMSPSHRILSLLLKKSGRMRASRNSKMATSSIPWRHMELASHPIFRSFRTTPHLWDQWTRNQKTKRHKRSRLRARWHTVRPQLNLLSIWSWEKVKWSMSKPRPILRKLGSMLRKSKLHSSRNSKVRRSN